jgi:hypothetical protein
MLVTASKVGRNGGDMLTIFAVESLWWMPVGKVELWRVLEGGKVSV